MGTLCVRPVMGTTNLVKFLGGAIPVMKKRIRLPTIEVCGEPCGTWFEAGDEADGAVWYNLAGDLRLSDAAVAACTVDCLS